MKFVAGQKGETREKPTQIPYRPPRIPQPRRELGTPAMEGERLIACAMKLLTKIKEINIIIFLT